MELDNTTSGEMVTWNVIYRDHRIQKATGYATDVVQAASLDLQEGGTLVFRAADGLLVRAYGPSGWAEVSRA